jgi:hypothetical protein
VGTTFESHLELTLKLLHPIKHEMHILEHAPMAFLCSLCKNQVSVVFLTLTHGNVGESTSLNSLVICETNLLNIGSWVNTWEQYEECRNLW